MPTKLAALDNSIALSAPSGAAIGWPALCSALANMRNVYLAGLLALGWGGGCTPSVPLPPPDLQALTFTSGPTPDVVQISSKPSQRQANARFYVFDFGSGDGVITQAAADGSFTSMPFTGKNGDGVQIYFDTTSGDRSEETCTTLQLNVGLISMECP